MLLLSPMLFWALPPASAFPAFFPFSPFFLFYLFSLYFSVSFWSSLLSSLSSSASFPLFSLFSVLFPAVTFFFFFPTAPGPRPAPPAASPPSLLAFSVLFLAIPPLPLYQNEWVCCLPSVPPPIHHFRLRGQPKVGVIHPHCKVIYCPPRYC